MDFVHLRESVVLHPLRNALSLDVSARAELDFAEMDEASLRILPAVPVEVSAPETGACISSVDFGVTAPGVLPARRIQELGITGSLFDSRFRISLPSANPVDPPEVFPLCGDSAEHGKTLTLTIAPSFSP